MKLLRFTAYAVAALCLLENQAQAQAFQPVTSPERAVQGFGFTVLPPSGTEWYVANDVKSSTVAFGKKDPEHLRQRGSVFLAVTLLKARSNDISTPGALRAEIEQTVRASSARFNLTNLSLESYVDAEMATDCVRISTTSEERNNPNRPGETLLMTVTGKACRHTLSPAYYVQATLSERRPVQSQPLVDDKLKVESDRAINNVTFSLIR
jgi:hypothetical protein